MTKRPSGVFNVSYDQELAVIHTRFQWVMAGLGLVFFCVLPLLFSLYVVDMFIRTMIILIVVMGVNLVTGYCGQLSLGHAAFAALGGFTGAILMGQGLHFVLALILASIAAGFGALIFALPVARIKGYYLAFTTLAAHFIIWFVLLHYAGGTRGHLVNPPIIAGFSFGSEFSYYYLVFAVLVLLTFAMKNLVRCKAGRAFIAIRDNDIAAETLGINVFAYKLLAFFVSGCYAGASGVLWVTYMRWASLEQFTLWNAIWYLGIVVVGGAGTVVGSWFGTFFIQGLNELIPMLTPLISKLIPALRENVVTAFPFIIFGVVIISFLIWEPRGLTHRWNIVKNTVRLFPYNY